MRPLGVRALWLTLCLGAVALVASDASAQGTTVLYVNEAVQTPGNGATWASAYRDLPAAIAAASTMGTVQIWVARGRYRPDEGTLNRARTFQMHNNVSIYGGFEGDETQLEQRDWNANPTILDGDLLGNDQPNFGAYGDNSYTVVTASSTSIPTNETAILDGFIIRGGNMQAPSSGMSGAGLIIRAGTPTIRNCTIRQNLAQNGGGGMIQDASPTLAGCTFEGNRGDTGGGGLYVVGGSSPVLTGCAFRANIANIGTNTNAAGGAMDIRAGTSPIIAGCVFEDNSARFGGGISTFQADVTITDSTFRRNAAVGDAVFTIGTGGGLHNNASTVAVIRCVFEDNTALGKVGGGIYNFNCAPDIVSSFFADNKARYSGAGVADEDSGSNTGSRVVNCVFTGNRCLDGAAVFGAGAGMSTNGAARIINSTFSQNSAIEGGALGVSTTAGSGRCEIYNSVFYGNGGTSQIELFSGSNTLGTSNSCVQGSVPGSGGPGNITSNPLFVDPDGPDNIAGTLDDDLRIAGGSPAIDRGDNVFLPSDAFDLDGDGITNEPLPVDYRGLLRVVNETNLPSATVNMGAYEVTLDAKVWQNPGNGVFSTGANWVGNAAPTASSVVVFDTTGGNPGTPHTVTFTAGAQTYQLRVLTSPITFNFLGSYTLLGTEPSAPPLLVSGDQTTRLILSAPTAGAIRTLTANWGVLALEPQASGRLTVRGSKTVLAVEDRLDVGGWGVGRLDVEQGARATVSGARLGTGAGSDGTLLVTDAGSTFVYAGALSDLVIGDGGDGSLTVQGAGTVLGDPLARRVTIGRAATGIGAARVTGAGSAWTTAGNEFIVGDAGGASLQIDSGGVLGTTTFKQIVMRLQPGPEATLSIGAGSRWEETLAGMVVGQAGPATVTLEAGAQLIMPLGVSLRRDAELRGGGTVEGGLTNLGRVAPGLPDPSPLTGILHVTGDYAQQGVVTGANDTGSLLVEAGGFAPGLDFDQLLVTGAAELGGGLYVELINSFVPSQPSLSLELVRAAQRTGTFDVAVLPPLPNNRFLRVSYSATSVLLGLGELDGMINFPGSQNFSVPGAPTGAALADLNADSLLDMLVAVPDPVNPTLTPGKVYVLLNLGNGAGGWNGYGPPAAYTVGRDPRAVAVGNFDNAGGPDLAIANSEANSVSVLINNGQGVFSPGATLLVGARPRAIGVADVDGAFGPDMLVANSGTTFVTLLRNQGGLKFKPDPVPVGPIPTSVDPIDVNNNGSPDFIVANQGDNTLSILINDGTGSLTNATTIPVGVAPAQVASGDLNGDGLRDVVVGNSGAASISVLVNEGGGVFAPPVEVPVGSAPRSIALLDMDGDNDLDVAAVIGAPPEDRTIRLVRNDLSGGQLSVVPIEPPLAVPNESPLVVLGGDVDNDNRKDIVAVNSDLEGLQNVSVLANEFAAACYADCDHNSALNVNDYICFQTKFALGDPYADCDGNGVRNVNDYICFQTKFALGCP